MYTRDTNLAIFPDTLLLFPIRAADVDVDLHGYPRTWGEPLKSVGK